MGAQGIKKSLVSMTNGDVYYINEKTAELIRDMLAKKEPLTSVTFMDVRSNARVTINAHNVSSIVVNAGYVTGDGTGNYNA